MDLDKFLSAAPGSINHVRTMNMVASRVHLAPCRFHRNSATSSHLSGGMVDLVLRPQWAVIVSVDCLLCCTW